jgi:hypothetical protein
LSIACPATSWARSCISSCARRLRPGRPPPERRQQPSRRPARRWQT